MSGPRNSQVLLRPYQIPVYEELVAMLASEKTMCLGACTGSGKTEIIAKLVQDNPGKTFLILAHGQTVLRTNFTDRLASYLRADELTEIRTKKDLSRHKRVMVAIPQGIYRKLNQLPQFDFLITDEGHQFYGAEKIMYSNILDWHQGKVALLTASHFRLRVPKVFFSGEEALAAGCIEDILLRRMEVDAQLNDKMFSSEGNLIESKVNKQIGTPIFQAILETIQNTTPAIVAVHRVEVADRLGKFLAKRKINVVISHSDNDKDSQGITDFKNGKHDVCVVVNRGELGFDYPAMKVLVDATFTQNVERIQQLVGRAQRKAEVPTPKLYVKLVPDGYMKQYEIVLTAVMALAEYELYRTWDGNYNNCVIKLKKESHNWNTEGAGKDKLSKSDDAPKKRKAYPMLETMFGAYLGMWKESDDHYVTTLADALHEVKMERAGRRVWTYEKLLESASKYTYKRAWRLGDSGAYHAASDYGVLDQLATELQWQPQLTYWTYEKLLKSASRYSGRSEWNEGDSKAYRSACGWNILQEIATELGWDAGYIAWTYPMLLESARKYSDHKNWKLHQPTAYRAAFRLNVYAQLVKETGWPPPHVKPVRCIDTNEVFDSVILAAQSRGKHANSLSRHLKGKRPTFDGHTWEYLPADEL